MNFIHSNKSSYENNNVGYTSNTIALITIGTIITSYAIITSFRLKKTKTKNKNEISSSSSASSTPPIRLRKVQAHDIFTPTELSDINNAYTLKSPRGDFIRGRHGYTHYSLEGPTGHTSKGLIILSHGLGTSLEMYNDISDYFTQKGYTILRYDFFNHGYSKYFNHENYDKAGDSIDYDMWIRYSPEILADQLEDLLMYVIGVEEEASVKILGFVGHSTGGLLGIEAMHRWKYATMRPYYTIPKVVLLSPAMYAVKPIVAQILDQIPDTFSTLLKSFPFLRPLIGDAYMEAGQIAFARDVNTKKYLYPDQVQAKTELDLRLFGRVKGVNQHPFLSAGIVGISGYTLRADLLPSHRAKLIDCLNEKKFPVDGKEAASQNDRFRNVEFHLVWGELDLTVPYKENVNFWKEKEETYSNIVVNPVPNIGHEAVYENSSLLAVTFEKIMQEENNRT